MQFLNKNMIKSIDFPEELIDEITTFRKKNFFKQFSPAIVYLVHLGLEYHKKMQYNMNKPIMYQPQQPVPLYPANWQVDYTGADDTSWLYTGYEYGSVAAVNPTGVYYE